MALSEAFAHVLKRMLIALYTLHSLGYVPSEYNRDFSDLW